MREGGRRIVRSTGCGTNDVHYRAHNTMLFIPSPPMASPITQKKSQFSEKDCPGPWDLAHALALSPACLWVSVHCSVGYLLLL